MPIITLTSDWGLKDHYLAVVKGSIMRQIPDAQIVDITHALEAYDIISASFVVRNSYTFFPEGTVHIVGINTEATLEHVHVAIKYNGHFFIGTDNGIFSLIFNDAPQDIVEIDMHQDSNYFTFSTRDIFVKAAVHILKNKNLQDLGTPKAKLIEKELIKPVYVNGIIKGNVIYVDRYENVITNLEYNLFREYVKKKPFEIKFRGSTYVISKISTSYSDVEEGDMLALFSTTGYLEIAINRGKAASLLGLHINDSVSVIIEES